MPQAVKVETQAEQRGLTSLDAQRAAGCAGRQLALDRREDALDQSAASVEAMRERPAHFGPDALDSPGLLPALGGNHALRPELLLDVGVIPLAVELGVGQHQPDAGVLRSRPDDG